MQSQRKVVKNRFYVIFTKDILRVRILPYSFSSKELAKHSITTAFKPVERKYYRVVTGKYLHKYHAEFAVNLTLLKFQTWKYPKELKTFQEKKSYRTLMRRRLRRMDLLIIGPRMSKVKSGEKTKRVKKIKNRQKVAICPTTEAKVVQLHRKGEKRYYLIEKTLESKRSGTICYLKTHCIDLRNIHRIPKNSRFYKQLLEVRNTDVLVPFLKSEIIKICQQKEIRIPKKVMMKLT